MEFAECAILRRHRTFTLQHVDFNRSLAVCRGRERFRFLGRNRRVARDHGRGHATERLDRER